MHYLLFDLQITGHHSEYIQHLVNHLASKRADDENSYYFLVPEAFKLQFSGIVDLSTKADNVHWLYIPNYKVQEIQKKSLYRRSFAEYHLVSDYAQRIQATNVCFLYFNVLQLALIFKRPKYNITGILFLQFYRMPTSSFKEKVKFFRKFMITYLYSLNPKIEKIFVLNDYEAVNYFNKKFRDIFMVLPDPIPEIEPLRNIDIRSKFQIKQNKKVFLHFGSLDDRKGTLEILKSIDFLTASELEKYTFILAGKSKNKDFENLIQQAITKYENSIQIIWINEFVSNQYMSTLFEQSDFILMPYKNAEASSGILGHAMRHRKRVLTTGKGLLKDLVNSFNMGLLLDNVTPIAISNALRNIETVDIKIDELKVFVKEHSDQQFASRLLESTRNI